MKVPLLVIKSNDFLADSINKITTRKDLLSAFHEIEHSFVILLLFMSSRTLFSALPILLFPSVTSWLYWTRQADEKNSQTLNKINYCILFRRPAFLLPSNHFFIAFNSPFYLPLCGPWISFNGWLSLWGAKKLGDTKVPLWYVFIYVRGLLL